MRSAYNYAFFFFFNDTATTEIYTLSLHDALPISTTFGRVASKTPSRTVSVFDSTTWVRPPGVAPIPPARSAEQAVRRLVGASVARRPSNPPAPTTLRRETRYDAT